MSWGNVSIDQTKEQGGELREKIKELQDYLQTTTDITLKMKVDELTSLVDKPKVDTGELKKEFDSKFRLFGYKDMWGSDLIEGKTTQTFTPDDVWEWFEPHLQKEVTTTQMVQEDTNAIKQEESGISEVTQTPTQPKTTSTDIEELRKEWDKYVDKILQKGDGTVDMYQKMSFPIDYAKWRNMSSIAFELLSDIQKENKWFHEFKRQIAEISSFTTLVTMFLQEKYNAPHLSNKPLRTDIEEIRKDIDVLEGYLKETKPDKTSIIVACMNNIERFIFETMPHLSNKSELKKEAVTGETSDGYHTFNELYEFRKLYNAALFNEWANVHMDGSDVLYNVHKSKRHSDGELCFGGGWFIVMATLPTGQISNHYELKDWDLFKIPEYETADVWDGHTAQDVAKRLNDYLLSKEEK